MTMSSNLFQKIQTNKTHGIIEIGEGSRKLSLDFMYIFKGCLGIGEIYTWNESESDFIRKYELYVCCTNDRKDAKKKLSSIGLKYCKDYLFAEDFFCLLDDWKGCKVAFIPHSTTFMEKIREYILGYAAKHGKISPEDQYRDLLSGGKLSKDVGWMRRKLFFAGLFIPGVFETLSQVSARKKNFESYDYICFYNVSDALCYKREVSSNAHKVITMEELKSHTMASLYMRATYFDRTQNFSACDVPIHTLWIGWEGTTRLCDCPVYLDISLGNIGVKNIDELWKSPLARIIRLSVINNTYTFCSRELCKKLSGKDIQNSLLERKISEGKDYPEKLDIGHDHVCNLHCASCRNEIYCKNDEKTETDLQTCTDAILVSDCMNKIDQLCVGADGESFLSKNYKKLLYDDASKGKNIIIMTNGNLFTEKEWEGLEGRYNSISFLISVDAATKETYEKLRRGGNFERLMHNMDFLSDLRKMKKVDSVTVIMIVQQANYREIPDFVRWAKDKEFDSVSLSHIRNWGTYEDDYFYENVSMFDRNFNMKQELKAVLENSVCNDPIVNCSWK